MIRSLLVANRGEIARRVFRTCRDLGIATVAVYSDADAGAPFVAEADAAVRLPGTSPAETYLRADLIIDAALRSGAEAVHPGYGFLSESAEFAREVQGAGLIWVGPPVEAIESMGSKIAAKELMERAGVPVLGRIDPAKADESDLPLLIKASYGGGGRGMRIVDSIDRLEDELELARAEAASAFGDPTVFCEPYIADGHHVEVQVMADTYGTVWAIGERECSIQRRHQKVLEESPSPLLERLSGVRGEMFKASIAATRAIDYLGAGTVEFLVDDSGRFFFLEMNTRLQVEHPVTESVTGLDLVALQLQVAEGAALEPQPPESRGHAIEVRLYAEDPAADYQPQSGTINLIDLAGVTSSFTPPTASGSSFGAGVRLDSGVESGSVVSVHYDAMLAKVIGWGPTRGEAARRLRASLERAKIHGIVTNRDLLSSILNDNGFITGRTDTSFLDGYMVKNAAADAMNGPDQIELAAVAAALAASEAARSDATVLRSLPNGWRNVVSQPQRRSFSWSDSEAEGRVIEVDYRFGRSGVNVAIDGTEQNGLVIEATSPHSVTISIDGVSRTFDVAAYGGTAWVDSPLGSVSLSAVPRFPEVQDEVVPGSLLAPMPGSIVRISATLGARVTRGEPLMWLEAMKMQHEIVSPSDGVLAELRVTEGAQVDVGDLLAVVADAEDSAPAAGKSA